MWTLTQTDLFVRMINNFYPLCKTDAYSGISFCITMIFVSV